MGGAGQQALAKALLIKRSSELPAARTNFPANALPLFVDEQGNCNLPGLKGFDEKLVRDFYKDLYETNLAAQETVSVAKSLHAQSAVILAQLRQKEIVEKQELASLNNRLSRLVRDNQRGQPAPTAESPLPIRMTRDRIADLEMLIQADEDARKQNTKLKFLANLALQNASRVQASAYDLCANSLRYCREGLFRLSFGGYLVGRTNAFVPIIKPLSEADFYEAISADIVNENMPYQPIRGTLAVDPTDRSQETKAVREAQEKNPALAWLRKDLQIILPPDQCFLDPSKIVTIDGFNWQSASNQNSARVVSSMVALDGSELKRPVALGKPMPRVYGNYPFANLPLPLGQILYYCAKAAETGDQPRVSWSVLARDFVCYHGQLSNNNSSSEFVGQPRQAADSNWFKPSDFGFFQQSRPWRASSRYGRHYPSSSKRSKTRT